MSLKVLVINIALRDNPFRIYQPIGLGYVASAIRRAGFEFELLDLDAHPQSPEQTEQFLRTHRYDVVAMGCIVTGYKYVKWLAGTIREAFPDTVIIAGNTVARSIPQILLTKTAVDVAAMCEGDELIVELLTRLQTSRDLEGIPGICYRRNGVLAATLRRPLINDIDGIPVPDWEIFDIETYIRSQSNIDEPLPPIPREDIRAMPMNTARGCPFSCTFCYHSFRGEKYRYRSPESIVQEMRHYSERYGINYFTFHDELTFFSVKQASAFADTLLASGLQVYWVADVRSGLFSKPEHIDVARKLGRAGCLALSYSLESASPDILKWMNKRLGPEAFLRQAEILAEAGLESHTSLVLGYPNETESTIKATIDVCVRAGVYPSAGYLLPQPGTPMYEYALTHGYIKDEEAYLLALGDRQDLRVNLTGMPNAELEAIVARELARCSQELGMTLSGGALLKTGFYRSPSHPAGKPGEMRSPSH